MKSIVILSVTVIGGVLVGVLVAKSLARFGMG